MSRTAPGRLGAGVERAAADWLAARGLALLAANVRFRFGEIDLVMREGDVVVFVEVRYRSHADYGGGAASVDARKCRRIARAAAAWLAARPRLAAAPARFDVLAASGEAAAPAFEWHRDAFRLDDIGLA